MRSIFLALLRVLAVLLCGISGASSAQAAADIYLTNRTPDRSRVSVLLQDVR